MNDNKTKIAARIDFVSYYIGDNGHDGETLPIFAAQYFTSVNLKKGVYIKDFSTLKLNCGISERGANHDEFYIHPSCFISPQTKNIIEPDIITLKNGAFRLLKLYKAWSVVQGNFLLDDRVDLFTENVLINRVNLILGA